MSSTLAYAYTCVYSRSMAKKTTKAKRPARPSLILNYLAEYPEREFRCHEIAAAIGHGVQPTANECARLARRGSVVRRGSEDPTVPTFYKARPDDR